MGRQSTQFPHTHLAGNHFRHMCAHKIIKQVLRLRKWLRPMNTQTYQQPAMILPMISMMLRRVSPIDVYCIFISKLNNQHFNLCSFLAEVTKSNENIVDDSIDSEEDDDEDYDDEGEIEINSGNELRDKDRIIAKEIDGLNSRIVDRECSLIFFFGFCHWVTK